MAALRDNQRGQRRRNLIVSTVVVAGRRFALATEMKRPVRASRPILRRRTSRCLRMTHSPFGGTDPPLRV